MRFFIPSITWVLGGSAAPTAVPTNSPTPAPTTVPSQYTTSLPSAETATVSSAPLALLPSIVPTPLPSTDPTNAPSVGPTIDPSANPTGYPSENPTTVPSAHPTHNPTAEPTSEPSADPTDIPTTDPTAFPTLSPSSLPTTSPTSVPTPSPTIYRAIMLSSARIYAEEGESVSYTVVLASQPESYVLVDVVTSSNAGLVSIITPLPLNFTTATWSTPQQIALLATQNSHDGGAISNDIALVHSASSSDTHYHQSVRFSPSNTIIIRIYDDESCVRDCSPGTYLGLCNHSQTCLPSPPGFYATGGCTSAIPCPRGTFLETSGGKSVAECKNCSYGKYASNLGSSTCVACPAGYA